MKHFFMTLWRLFVSWNVGLIVAVVTFFLFDYQFLLSFLSGTAVMFITSAYMKRKAHRIVASDLLKEEKEYIRSQLVEARKKWKRISRARFKVRSLVMWQKISRISNAVEKMIAAVEQDPRRFRAAQSFFISKLDPAVTIIEKYVYLVNQPVRNQEMSEALLRTEKLLDELVRSTEQELLQMLSDDVFHLDIETKLLKQSLEQPKQSPTMEWRKETEEEYETVR